MIPAALWVRPPCDQIFPAMAGNSLPSSDRAVDRLFRELKAAFRRWPGPARSGEEWSEQRFASLALDAFRLQYEDNAPYRRYCDRRGVDPDSVAGWREVPPVPTAGFRAVPLIVGGPEAAVLEFRTSGTSGRLDRRGRHLVRDPSVYRASLEKTFRAFVLGRGPGVDAVAHMLSLIPPFAEAPHSSLSWMVDAVMDRFAGDRACHAATAEGIDWSRAAEAVEAAIDAGRPLCVLSTTLAAAEWMDRMGRGGAYYELPPGSILMDTGGAKGRPGLERSAMIPEFRARLGLPPDRVVNEFGMTELLSQRYTSGPAGGRGSEDTETEGWLAGPPWLRTRALDPETLEELPTGEVGVLCHFDLANAGSVCAVLTEDLGRVRDGRVEYHGRAGGSPPRGCSLATAELLDSQPRSVSPPAETGTSAGEAG